MSLLLHELNDLVAEMYRLETEALSLKKDAAGKQELSDQLRAKILAELTEQGLDSFEASVGKVYKSTRYQVKFPNGDPDKKHLLKHYLVENGAFEALWSINHQSLNAWHKQEIERQQEAGIYPDVPGLTATSDTILNFRKSTR